MKQTRRQFLRRSAIGLGGMLPLGLMGTTGGRANQAETRASEAGAQTDNVGLQFLSIPHGAGTRMPAGTQYADYVNCHNYITHPSWPGLHDNQTWLSASPGRDCRVSGLYKNHGRTWRKAFVGYSILNQPATVHDLLLQKSNGVFELVLWGERFAGGSDDITVDLKGREATVHLYDPTRGTLPVQTLADPNSIALTLTNHPVIIEIIPKVT
jgi:hypothetical protein